MEGIFDTHAHLDDPAFDGDREELLAALHANGVALILDPGCDAASSRRAQTIAAEHDFVYFAAGLHPEELKSLTEDTLSEVRILASDAKCRAIGEIGLDYYWDASQKELQKEIFDQQLKLAEELGKPVIVHDREAHGDSLEIVRRHPEARGVFHCFSGSREMAEELLRRGWYLGFDGPITYKNARRALEVLAIVPLERMLIETDSPYLSPVPMRGKRNDPGNLRYVLEKIAEVRGESAEELARITRENGKRLFDIA